jgi:hypothetical protein
MVKLFKIVKFFRNKHGAIALEFALILPIVLTLVMGLFEYRELLEVRQRTISSVRLGLSNLAIKYTARNEGYNDSGFRTKDIRLFLDGLRTSAFSFNTSATPRTQVVQADIAMVQKCTCTITKAPPCGFVIWSFMDDQPINNTTTRSADLFVDMLPGTSLESGALNLSGGSGFPNIADGERALMVRMTVSTKTSTRFILKNNYTISEQLFSPWPAALKTINNTLDPITLAYSSKSGRSGAPSNLISSSNCNDYSIDEACTGTGMAHAICVCNNDADRNNTNCYCDNLREPYRYTKYTKTFWGWKCIHRDLANGECDRLPVPYRGLGFGQIFTSIPQPSGGITPSGNGCIIGVCERLKSSSDKYAFRECLCQNFSGSQNTECVCTKDPYSPYNISTPNDVDWLKCSCRNNADCICNNTPYRLINSSATLRYCIGRDRDARSCGRIENYLASYGLGQPESYVRDDYQVCKEATNPILSCFYHAQYNFILAYGRPFTIAESLSQVEACFDQW